MIKFNIDGCVGYALNQDGSYRLDFNDGSSRESTEQEILQAVKETKINSLKAACKSAIEAGFYSSALGSPHLYDYTLPQDQIKILGAKLSGVDMLFTCTDSGGVKMQRHHTSIQITQVFLDGMTHIQANTEYFYTKVALVNSATSISEVNLVEW